MYIIQNSLWISTEDMEGLEALWSQNRSSYLYQVYD